MKPIFFLVLALFMHYDAHCALAAAMTEDPKKLPSTVEVEQDPPDELQVDKMPSAIHTEHPSYPRIARQEGITGMVWLKLLIGEDGSVKKSKVTKSIFSQKEIEVNLEKASSTVKLAIDSLTLACVKSAGQWKFTPAILKDKPVKVWVVLPFKFKLDGPHNDEMKGKK